MNTAPVEPPEGGEPVSAPRGTRRGWRRRAWLWAGILPACAALGWGGLRAWSWYTQPTRVVAALPARPPTAGWPVELAERLDAAQRRAGRHADVLGAVAELGRLYHANGFMPEAEACWRLLRREQPGEAQWAHLLADVRRAASDYEEMEALLREVVRLDPDYAPAWLQLGELTLKTGRMEEAARAFRRRLELKPADPDGLLGLARLALQDGRRPEARRRLEAVVRDEPRFSPAQNLLAEVLAAEGDEAGAAKHRHLGNTGLRYFEAEDPWLDALTASCLDPSRLRVLATIEFQIERGDRGVALMERAVRLAPEDPDGYAVLGDLFIKLGDGARAREALQECLRLATSGKPPAVMVYVNLSHALRLLKQPEECLQVLRRGLEQHRDAFELFDEAGIVLGDLGRMEDAVEAFRRSIAGNPGDPNANFNLAVALLRLGRRSEAYAALEQSLTLKPNFPQSLTMLGRLELEEGRMAEAEKHLRQLYSTHPHVPEGRRMLAEWELRMGLAAERRGELASAEKHYRAGVEIDPGNPRLQASLGSVLLLQERADLAVAPLEAFRRLEPANPQAALFLGQAYARLGRRAEARTVLTEGAEQADRAGNASTAAFCREILQQLR